MIIIVESPEFVTQIDTSRVFRLLKPLKIKDIYEVRYTLYGSNLTYIVAFNTEDDANEFYSVLDAYMRPFNSLRFRSVA